MSTQRVLRDAVSDRVFAPAYYLHGENDYLKEQAVRQLVEAALDPTTREFNLEVKRGNEVSAEALGSLLATPPLMADRRVIIVRDAGGLRKDARTVLDHYLKTPAADTLVLLVVPAGSKVDRLLAAKTTVLEFEPLTGDRVPKWITYHAEVELNTPIAPEAVVLLESVVGSDLPLLALELDKLASFSNGQRIDESAVSALVGVRPEETIGRLLDAVALGDAPRALKLLPGVLAQPKTSAVTLVMALTAQVLAMGWARARRGRGRSSSRLSGDLFGLLKEAGNAYTGRPWGEAVNAWARGVSTDDPSFDGTTIDAALDALLVADQALKETRLSSEEQVMTTLILNLCSLSRTGVDTVEHA